MEILLRSSWQAVNIGDIAHTPAMLALIEKYLSNTKVTVWASEDITKEIRISIICAFKYPPSVPC